MSFRSPRNLSIIAHSLSTLIPQYRALYNAAAKRPTAAIPKPAPICPFEDPAPLAAAAVPDALAAELVPALDVPAAAVVPVEADPAEDDVAGVVELLAHVASVGSVA